MSVLEERQNSRKTFCHNYADKTDPTIIHYGCDQEVKWKDRKKYNMDGTPHYCTHSNETRSKANEAANNTAAALKPVLEGKSVKDAFKGMNEGDEIPSKPIEFKPASDFSPQDEFIISIGRLNTNVEKLLELHMQTNELLKQVIKVKEAK